jgi:hypothetical protein
MVVQRSTGRLGSGPGSTPVAPHPSACPGHSLEPLRGVGCGTGPAASTGGTLPLALSACSTPAAPVAVLGRSVHEGVPDEPGTARCWPRPRLGVTARAPWCLRATGRRLRRRRRQTCVRARMPSRPTYPPNGRACTHLALAASGLPHELSCALRMLNWPKRCSISRPAHRPPRAAVPRECLHGQCPVWWEVSREWELLITVP